MSCDDHVIYDYYNIIAPAEREKRVRESVERAKEAVAEDVKDGISWSEWAYLSKSAILMFLVTFSII